MVLQGYTPKLFTGESRIHKGWKVREPEPDSPHWDVIDTFGRKVGVVGARTVGNLNKTPVYGDTGRTVMQEVGKEIKRDRELKEWTCEMLGSKIGSTRQYISNIENGSGHCSLIQLAKICDILNFELRIKVVRKYSNGKDQCLNTNKEGVNDQTT